MAEDKKTRAPDGRGPAEPEVVYPEQQAGAGRADVVDARRSRQSPLPDAGLTPDAKARPGRGRVSLGGGLWMIAGVVLVMLVLALLL